MFLFSKGWGIKHISSEHVMANISHSFFSHSYLSSNLVIHKHNKLKQKRCQNDVRLRRIVVSSIVICLTQRELISVNFVN